MSLYGQSMIIWWSYIDNINFVRHRHNGKFKRQFKVSILILFIHCHDHVYDPYNSERFEPRWVIVVVWVIVRVCSVVLRWTVVGVDWRFDNLSGSHHRSDGIWWWLPLRLSKRQSTPTTVLLGTTLQTRTITQTTTMYMIHANAPVLKQNY